MNFRALLLATVTVAVRLAVSLFPQSALPSVDFSLVTPYTAASSWKEAAFWVRQFGYVPAHLVSFTPWYVAYLPCIASDSAMLPPYVWLSVADGISIYIISAWWGNLGTAALLALVTLNPLLALLPAMESLAPLHYLVMVLIVECCRRRSALASSGAVQRTKEKKAASGSACGDSQAALDAFFPLGCGAITGNVASPKQPRPQGAQPQSSHARFVLYTTCALLLTSLMGLPFAAVAVALVFPVGTPTTSKVVLAYLSALVGVGGTVLYFVVNSPITALHSPPDDGVLWYVRQLIIPSFKRSLDAALLQLPTWIIAPILCSMPPVHTAALLQRGLPPPCTACVVFALYFCVLGRFHVIVADVIICAVITFALFPRVFMSACGTFLAILVIGFTYPQHISFYLGWAGWGVANGNWVFFCQLGFMCGSCLFAGSVAMRYFSLVLRASGHRLPQPMGAKSGAMDKSQ